MKKKLVPLFFSFLTLCAFGFVNPAWPQDAQVKAAEALRKEGRYAEAINALQSAIAILQAKQALETPYGAMLLNNLGELHYQLGRMPKLSHTMSARSHWQATGGANRTRVSITATLALSISSPGGPPTPLRLTRTPIAILSRLPGERVQLASTLNNIATLFEDQKRYGGCRETVAAGNGHLSRGIRRESSLCRDRLQQSRNAL